MKLIITTLLSCFVSLAAFSQRMAFENLTVDDGLSQNSVLAIVQDNRGFMWYGTQYGLNKYDTRTFKVYRYDRSDKRTLSSNYITCLFLDSNHRLWVGTRNGLNKYNPESDDFDRINLTGPKEEQSALIISSIYEDHEQNIWVWSSSGLKLLGNHSAEKFITVPVPDSVAGLNGTNTHTIFQDHAGTYWIGSSAGLTKMKKHGSTYRFEMFKHNDREVNSLSDNYVTSIIEDAKFNLWIGTLHGGVNELTNNRKVFIRFSGHGGASSPVNNNIRILKADGTGHIWIGTQGGLSVLDPNGHLFKNYRHDPEDKSSLSQNSIYSIFIDKSNTVWIGTYWGGINMLSNYNSAFLTYQTVGYHPQINNNVVSAVAEDKKRNLWIGTEGGGLIYLDRAKDKIATFQSSANNPTSLGSDLIKVIYVDRDQNIWAGTHGGGLNLFIPVSQTFKRYFYKENDPVTLGSEFLSILEDTNSNFWIGTQNGLLLFNRNKTVLRPVSMPILNIIGKKSVKALLKDNEGNIWIGTSGGLYMLNQATNQTALFTLKDGLMSNDINCLYKDSRNRIWVGTYYGGFAEYQKGTKRFITYSEKEGLANNNVLSFLEEDNNNLWISTGNGLSKFTINSQSFRNYSKRDGLETNTFNINASCKTSYNEMLFGGFNGLTSFYPSQIKDNNIAPPIIITALKVFNKPVLINKGNRLLKKDISLNKSVVFPYAQNVFTLDFAALNYIKSEKNRYAYKLDGFDREWIHTNIPSASYTNLSPGKYVFWVKGTNNDGVWGRPVSLHVEVLPPFWQTKIAYLLYILFLGSIITLLARYFILRSLLKRDHELTQLKLNFFTNISHEIRTHLSLIYGPVEKLLMTANQSFESNRQLQVIKKNSDSLLLLINELMDFRKAETGNLKLSVSENNIVYTLHEIYTSFNEVFVSRNISSNFTSSAKDIQLYFDEEQLAKVFYNLLYNSYKFTEKNGYINVVIDEKPDSVVINIVDNGKGIAPENLKNLFKNYFQENDHGKQNTGYGIGLALSKSIVELHKGAIRVESKLSAEGNRTSFEVTLKKGKHHFRECDLKKYTGDEQKTYQVNIEDTSNSASDDVNAKPEKSKKSLVLLVEDNPDMRLFISESLRHEYTVITARNGLSGLNTARETIPDIIISDVMMPEMDGFTLCEQLKTDECTNHIPVIILTAKSSAPNQINGLKKGADVYLTKPFSIEILRLQMRNLLKAREKIRQSYSQQLKSTYHHTGIIPVSHLNSESEIKELLATVDNDFLNGMIKLIENRMDDADFGVAVLAKEMAMSQPVLYKKLYALTGMSVNDFIKSIKMNKAVTLLQSRGYTISEIAYKVGFSDPKYFSKEFKKQYGKSPSEFMY